MLEKSQLSSAVPGQIGARVDDEAPFPDLFSPCDKAMTAANCGSVSIADKAMVVLILWLRTGNQSTTPDMGAVPNPR
jgi:hypothetical protein